MKAYCDAVKKHFMASYKMLTGIMNICPEKRWYGTSETDALWKRLLHTMESLDYWINGKKEYRFEHLFKGFSAEMNVEKSSALPPERIDEYIKVIDKDVEKWFDELDDAALMKNSRRHPKVKNVDIVLTQIRHIQTNIGYCNEVLRKGGCEGVQWIECGL